MSAAYYVSRLLIRRLFTKGAATNRKRAGVYCEQLGRSLIGQEEILAEGLMPQSAPLILWSHHFPRVADMDIFQLICKLT
jgi:hypothetical protein